MSADRADAAFYLVYDGGRVVALAAKIDGRLFCYVPNADTFVYNKPISVDFMIDRNKRYVRVDLCEAVHIITEGRIGRVNDRDSTTLTDWAYCEPQRLSRADVLGATPT